MGAEEESGAEESCSDEEEVGAEDELIGVEEESGDGVLELFPPSRPQPVSSSDAATTIKSNRFICNTSFKRNLRRPRRRANAF